MKRATLHRLAAALGRLTLLAAVLTSMSVATPTAGAAMRLPAGAHKLWPGGDHTLLFVIEGDTGQLIRSGGHVELRLGTLRRDVIWFDDRPGRHAGRMSLRRFIDAWSANGFTKDPPNAVIQEGRARAGNSTPVVLMDPTLDARAGALTFRVRADKGASLARLRGHLGRVAVFVDDGTTMFYVPVSLSFTLQNPGSFDELQINPDSQAAWSAGPAFSRNAGIQITSPQGSIDVQALTLSDSRLTIQTGQNASPPVQFTINLYLAAPIGTNFVSLIVLSQPGDQIVATVNDQPPTVWSSGLASFPLNNG